MVRCENTVFSYDFGTPEIEKCAKTLCSAYRTNWPNEGVGEKRMFLYGFCSADGFEKHLATQNGSEKNLRFINNKD